MISSTSENNEIKPLDGITVVEFAGLGPGPFCGMMLADMGARVIRIDRENNKSSHKDTILGRGRESITLDLKKPNHVDVAKKIIAMSDILLEGFRPGVMEKLGLGPEVVHEINENLIYTRITGWGQKGIMADKAGHDINYIGISGVLNSIGINKPVVPLNLIGDYAGGSTMASVQILSALRLRSIGHKNIVIDNSMAKGASYLLSLQYELLASGLWKDERFSNFLDGYAPYYDVYKCKDDKYMAVGAIEEKFYINLINALDLNNKLDSIDRYNTNNYKKIRDLLEISFNEKTQEEWVEHFSDIDACVSPVYSMTDIINGNEITSSMDLLQIRHGNVAEPSPSTVKSLSNLKPSPQIGEHTSIILSELLLSPDYLET